MRQWPFVALIFFSGLSWASTELESARQALLKGDFETADQHYRKISPDDPLFKERIEDAIRFQILKKYYREAWRLTQVAERINLEFDDLEYYEKLTAVRSGACLFGYKKYNNIRDSLMMAYTYRYYRKFIGGDFDEDAQGIAEQGKRVSYLEPNRTFYLNDIPKAKILPRMGCRLGSGRFEERETSQRYELSWLKSWFRLYNRQPEEEQLQGSGAVLLRLLLLADKFVDEQTADEVLVIYQKLQPESWLDLPDHERRYIWQRMQEWELLKPPPYSLNSKEGRVILEILTRSQSNNDSYWLSQIEISKWPAGLQDRILKRLLNRPEVKLRPQLLHQKMLLNYRKGEIVEALSTIRQLLIDGDSESDQEVESNAIKVALAIFSEYRYDRTILGAIQTALPAEAWSRVFRSLLIRHALAGNRRAFAIMMDELEKSGRNRQLGLSKKQMSAIKALLDRNGASFRQQLNGMKRAKKFSGEGIRFLELVASELIALDQSQRSSVSRFLKLMTEELENHVVRSSNPKRYEGILATLDDKRFSQWMKGSETVKRGILIVGAVDLRNRQIKEAKFTWRAPASLPRRPLLVMPVTAVKRDWHIR